MSTSTPDVRTFMRERKHLFRLRVRKLPFLFCFVVVFHLMVSAAFGQADGKVQVSGTVTDSAGIGIPKVTVTEAGTRNSSVTDDKGAFRMEVANAQVTLNFSSVGYAPLSLPLEGRTTVTVIMNRTVASLGEVVVIGYGTVQKKDLTSAVTTITSEEFVPGAVNNALQLIEGKVAGVTVSSTAAADPNAGTNIQVRGAASISAGNSPLIVIDGMPGGDLRNVAQQDIASITVLKDASASAIYGSRGANGVILVQTKQGKAGKTILTYDSYVEKDLVAAKPDILSAEEFLARERDQDRGARVNWYDELLREDNFGHNQYLSLSGGNENSMFRISGNYKEKTGLDIASERKEYGIRANFLQKALDGLFEFSGNFAYRIVNEEYTNYGAFKQAVKLNPTIPVMDPNDPTKYNFLQGFDTYNPVQNLKTRENGADQTYSTIDINVKLNLLANLNSELRLSRQGHDQLRREYYNSLSAESISNNRTGRARLNNEKWADYTLEWLGNYFTNINGHDIRAVGGYSYQEFNNQWFWAENMNFPSDAFSYNNLDQGSWNMERGRLGMDSYKSREKTIAFLGRVNYNYENTYFVTASARYEGNTKFGANNKWGMFPAVAVAWRFSNLDALESASFIDDMKLRLSYGETGRSGFPRYTSLARYTGYGQYLNGQGQWVRVYGPANNFNQNLKWEKAISYNIGLDFTLFDQALNGSLDFFDRQSMNLLSDYDVPVGSYVHTQLFVNVGNTSSKGVELSLDWNAIRGKDFTYTTNLTASYIKATLKSWSNDQFHSAYRELGHLPSPGNPGPAYRLEDHQEIGSFYGYRYAGVNDEGKIMIWKDAIVGKEKIIASSEGNFDRDRAYIGHGAPRYQLSWGNSFEYRNFDLSLYFLGRFDYQILNLYQMYFGLQAEPGVNLLKDAYTRNGHITSGKVITDYFLEDGDYLKLDYLSLGYTFRPQSSKLQSLRVYGTVRNVFTLTGYTGLDPSNVNITGLEPGMGSLDVYPIGRNVSLGVRATF